MTFTLGAAPQQLTVRLSRDADFLAGIRTLDGSAWSATAVATIRIGATVWTATRTTTVATNDTLSWNVDKAAVNTLLDTGPTAATLFYVDGTADLLWARGPVLLS